MTAEPTREEVLQWLAHTGRTQLECVDELWGPVSDQERRRIAARVRQWVRRARNEPTPSARQPPPPARNAAGPSPAVAPPTVSALPPDPPPARPPAPTPDLGRVEWLRAQLAELLYDAAQARTRGDLRLVPTLDRRLSEVRAELDDELSRTRGAVNIERTPGALYAELDRRARAIALRAEMARRREAREEQAAQREAAAPEEGA